jgi:5-methylcytosine-specific restriction enzyme A
MPPKPCLQDGCRDLAYSGSRCAGHQRLVERRKRARRPDYDHAERQRRARAVTAHVATFGYVCPGWRRPPHPSTDLTADHVYPVALGGPERGPLRVVCRKCNSARGVAQRPPKPMACTPS